MMVSVAIVYFLNEFGTQTAAEPPELTHVSEIRPLRIASPHVDFR